MKEYGLKATRTPLAMALLFSLATTAALAADVEVRDAWVRGTVTGQQATGAFLEITSKSGAALVGATSPAAAISEIHEMKMDGGVMKMRPVARLELPAGQTVQLAPGGYHVMLMKLKQPLKKGDSVPLTLHIEGPDKTMQAVEVQAAVRDLTASGSSAGEHGKH
ncbi:copper chaperone PCu(A)C [Accumulibacter sp.]|uniref:copper chaperone PCu(A)C n=1 Tax=Accumulibacter sp. TaxID=2053492 RepID=UPI0035AE0D7B